MTGGSDKWFYEVHEDSVSNWETKVLSGDYNSDNDSLVCLEQDLVVPNLDGAHAVCVEIDSPGENLTHVKFCDSVCTRESKKLCCNPPEEAISY